MPSLHGALDIVAGRRPDSPALAWRKTVWTYSDLRAAAALVENALRGRKLERGARVRDVLSGIASVRRIVQERLQVADRVLALSRP